MNKINKTKQFTVFRSCALWKHGVFAAPNTFDTHSTKEQALAVCNLLKAKGAGGDGIHFPLHTWVEEIEEIVK